LRLEHLNKENINKVILEQVRSEHLNKEKIIKVILKQLRLEHLNKEKIIKVILEQLRLEHRNKEKIVSGYVLSVRGYILLSRRQTQYHECDQTFDKTGIGSRADTY
jgi:hypothetical protein